MLDLHIPFRDLAVPPIVLSVSSSPLFWANLSFGLSHGRLRPRPASSVQLCQAARVMQNNAYLSTNPAVGSAHLLANCMLGRPLAGVASAQCCSCLVTVQFHHHSSSCHSAFGLLAKLGLHSLTWLIPHDVSNGGVNLDETFADTS